jgi:formate dehydrogenase alpha subunit
MAQVNGRSKNNQTLLSEESMIELVIDGKKIEVNPGTSVMDAALANDIDIPRLCYQPGISVSGNCRMCIVEVEGRQNPATSCELECQEDMVIRTHTENLYQLRRDTIDLYLADHPLDCTICEKSGSCSLQKYAYEHDIKETSYEFSLSRTLYQDDNPFFIRDHQYCILCGKCVRVCDEIVGANAIEFAHRGTETFIATPFNQPLAESSCVFCGNCVQVCPTATLMPVSRKGKGREWEFDRIKSICGYCGVGCQIEYAVKDNEIIYAQSTPDAPANGEYLCTKGRYGWDFATSPDRLKTPMIRKDLAYELGLTEEPWELPETSPLNVKNPQPEDNFIPTDWDTALDLVAEKLADTVKTYGPDSVMGFTSARCTNEENYLFQKFMRAGIGTNNIDHCARL